MKQILTAAQVAERYGVSIRTAQRYMRKMEHMEKPLRVTAQALEAWEIGRTYEPIREKAVVRKVRTAPTGKFRIPRARPT